MLVECETIGHSGKIVCRNARSLRLVRGGGEVAPFTRQALRLGKIKRKQGGDHPMRFLAHSVDPIVAIHPLEPTKPGGAILSPPPLPQTHDLRPPPPPP